MTAYNILEARNSLSRILTSVESGAEVTITNRGRPVAKLVPVDDRPHTGAALATWLASNPTPPRIGRTREELDASIAENRGAWE